MAFVIITIIILRINENKMFYQSVVLFVLLCYKIRIRPSWLLCVGEFAAKEILTLNIFFFIGRDCLLDVNNKKICPTERNPSSVQGWYCSYLYNIWIQELNQNIFQNHLWNRQFCLWGQAQLSKINWHKEMRIEYKI